MISELVLFTSPRYWGKQSTFRRSSELLGENLDKKVSTDFCYKVKTRMTGKCGFQANLLSCKSGNKW